MSGDPGELRPVPRPLRPGDRPGAFRASDAVAGFAVAIAVGFLSGVAGGFVGGAWGSSTGQDLGGLAGAVMGFGIGTVAGLAVLLAAAWQRRASPGFRVGVALVFGVLGLLTSACFLGV